MQVPPRGQHVHAAQQVATWRGVDVAAIQRLQDAGDLAIGAKQRIQAHALGGVRDAGSVQHLGALGGVGWLAYHMQAMRDQRVFQFQQRAAKRMDRRHRVVPDRLRSCKVHLRRLRLDQPSQCGALADLGIRFQGPPAINGGFQVEQPTIKPSRGNRRRQVTDQRRTHAALGQHALRWVVRGIEVEVRQVADQPVRPASGRHARLLARHEFQRAMGAEMQHRMGAKILGKPAVEGGESVGRCEAALEQQAHRVAFVAEAGLYADEHVPELHAKDEDVAAIGLNPARRRSPDSLDLLQPWGAPHMPVHINARADIGGGAELLAVAVDDHLAQDIVVFWDIHRVAGCLHRGQRMVQ